MIKRKRVLAAIVETTSGTLEAVTSADSIYGAYDIMIQPNIAFDQRPADGSFSQDKGTLNTYNGTATFKTELRGDGAGIGSPQWATVLLPACGYVDTANTFSPVTASPGTGGVKTLSIWVYEDGVRKVLRGAAGNVKFNFKTGARIELEWTFQGAFQAVSDGTILAGGTAYGTAMRFTGAAITVGAHAIGCIESMTLDIGNEVYLRPCPTASDGSGIAAAQITNRGVKGTMDPEARLVATEAVWAEWLNGTQQALSVALDDGTDVITFAAPKMQRTNIQEADRSGIVTDQIDFQCNKSAAAGDDELTITFAVA